MTHPLVEQAQAALCRLADAPPAAEAARAAVAELERLWDRPLAVGIGGEIQGRTELFNACCGDKLLDPFGRALGGAALRLRRGPVTRFRVQREVGSTEEHAMPPDRRADIEAARGRVDAARNELVTCETALARVDLPRRPAWWQLWRWPLYALALWLAPARRAERKVARRATMQARDQLEAIDKDATAIEAHARIARTRYLDLLRSFSGGGPTATGVVEVELTVATGPLAEGIEVLELTSASRASAQTDAVFLVQGDQVFAPVRGGPLLAIGDFARTVATLPSLLADARALRLARRTRDRLDGAMRSLDESISRKEASFQTRLERIEALRLADATRFADDQLAGVQGEIAGSVNTVMEHAAVHLGSELAQLQDRWIGSIANAKSPDELKAAVTRIEEGWHAEPRRIADEVRVLVMGGLGGSARDLYPQLVAALIPHGLPAEHAGILRAAPALAPIVLLPSLTKESARLEKAGWLSGLFRGFEARRVGLRENVHQRLEHMREIAEAELLDAEPRLHGAIREALVGLLGGALDRQRAALDQMLAAEHAVIRRERETMAPLVRVHDGVRADRARLADMITQLERDQPAVAVAAAAAETASLSH